jgi:sensor histidine kinase YesM
MKLLKKLNQLFPFFKLLKLLVILSIVLQTLIITYNHFSGYYNVPDFGNFISRLLYSSILTTIAGFMIAYPNLFIIHILNQSFSWNKSALKRIIIQFFLTVVFAVIISIIITTFAHAIDPYEEGLYSVLIANALIFSVVNIILMIALEAQIFFHESKESKTKAEILENELSQIRFEVLKNQINPHFMFNSLNVLSGLIENDVSKAQEFIDEFSMIYRYVLETIDKKLVTLKDELGFVRSYFFLQQIRYGNDLSLDVSIPANLLDLYLPPLSLQIVLENAIKHNVINESKPLKIEIYHIKKSLHIKNNIQAKISSTYSSGIGQENLKKRYKMIHNQLPEFNVEAMHYVVKLPLIEVE